MKEINRRFSVVKEHIKNTLKVNEQAIADQLEEKSDELQRMVRHPFFKQIGQFKGFSQDSLVMKRARGYSDIYRSWLILQSGFELEDDIHRLEVKDISELYEIWCFIKVKNMVAEILGDGVIAKSSGKELSTGFIRQLVYGSQSEVKFSKDDVELATVMYNAQVEDDDARAISAIEETTTFTTVQRPDIGLRLSKQSETDIVYTYLFDAKYRLSDKRINGDDVPPVDAINQMHRYRDAIYYAMKKGILKARNPFRIETVTQADLDALVTIPTAPADKAKLPRMGYETIKEMFAERGHLSQPALVKLNPGVDWAHVKAGQKIVLPDFPPMSDEFLAAERGRPNRPKRPEASLVRVSVSRCTVSAYDANGATIAHFPCSIAADKAKVPSRGELKITSCVAWPNFTYTPDHTPSGRKVRRHVWPEGENCPVGVAWMGLNLPGYGIHGTPRPESIGYTGSHGCFRLANWNAARLLAMCKPGTRVVVEP